MTTNTSILNQQRINAPISPSAAQNKKSGKYPTTHNKTHTADLS